MDRRKSEAWISRRPANSSSARTTGRISPRSPRLRSNSTIAVCCRLSCSYGVGSIVDALYKVGISGQDTIVGINQGWKLSGAIRTAGRRLADKTLVHGGQRLMAWAVSNARVEPRGNAIVITKQASGTAKIDPLMAALSSVAWTSANPALPQPSIFD